MTDWKTVKLGDVAEVIDCLHKTPKYSNQGYNMVRVTDIKGGVLDLKNTLKVDEETFLEFSRKYKPLKGDIVFSRVGTTGNVCYVGEDNHFCLGQNTVFIVPREDKKYFYFTLTSVESKNQIESLATGSTQKTISMKSIREIEFSLPPLPTQRKIAKVLGDLDDKIELNRRMNETLEEMAMAVYRHYFVNFGIPPGAKEEATECPFGKLVEHPEMGMIPAGWKVGIFTEYVNILGGGTPKTQVAEFWNGDIPFFTPKDVQDSVYLFETERYITQRGLKACNSKLYEKDTIFITARGTVGKIVLAGIPMAMSQSNYAIIHKEKGFQFFTYLYLQDQMSQLLRLGHGAVFNTITTDTFKNLYIVFPDSITMEKFNKQCNSIFEKLFSNSQEIQSLTETRDYLLPRLLSGEVRVE